MLSNNIIQLLLSKYSANGIERVGFIIDEDIVEVTNISKSPDGSFMVGSADVLMFIESSGPKSTWHTHPNSTSNLSGEDALMFKSWPEYEHIIIGNDGIRVYKYNDSKGALIEVGFYGN